MTPKEKAIDLIYKYDFTSCMSEEQVKQCALICVDEILNQYNNCKFDYKILYEQESEYWQEVKTEINKL